MRGEGESAVPRVEAEGGESAGRASQHVDGASHRNACVQKFDALEAESFAKLTKMIAAAKHTPAPVFNALLNKIYKRQK